MMPTTSISHISRLVSLESWASDMSVDRMTGRISFVDDFEVTFTTLRDYVPFWTQMKIIQKFKITHTHTHTLLPEGHDAQTAYRRPLEPSGPWNHQGYLFVCLFV